MPPEKRPHDQHCAACDAAEFSGVTYASTHANGDPPLTDAARLRAQPDATIQRAFAALGARLYEAGELECVADLDVIYQRVRDAFDACVDLGGVRPATPELDRQVADYKRRCDAGETVSASDLRWLLNELVYERDHRGTDGH